MRKLKGKFYYEATEDGRYSAESSERTVWLRNAQGDVISKFYAREFIRGPVFSPDGSLLAIFEAKGKRLYLFDLPEDEKLEHPRIIKAGLRLQEIDDGFIFLEDQRHIILKATTAGCCENILAYNIHTGKATTLYHEHIAVDSFAFNRARNECLLCTTTFGDVDHMETREGQVGRLRFHAEGDDIFFSYEQLITHRSENGLWPGVRALYGSQEGEILCITASSVERYMPENGTYCCVQRVARPRTGHVVGGQYPLKDGNHLLIADRNYGLLFSVKEMRFLKLYKKEFMTPWLLPLAYGAHAFVLGLDFDYTKDEEITNQCLLVGDEQEFLNGDYDEILCRASPEEEREIGIE